MTNQEDFVTVGINESEESLEYYVIIKGQNVPCSHEVYLTIKRPGRKENTVRDILQRCHCLFKELCYLCSFKPT